jgi:hypothetical protein
VKPTTRAALSLLLSREWVSGNDLMEVAGTRYPARLGELKPLGWRWKKRWVRGRSVPMYRIYRAEPEQQTLRLDVAS